MIRIIDRNGDKVVQKVSKLDGTFLRFQHGIPGSVMTEVKTLCEARAAIGKAPVKQMEEA